MGSDRYPHLLCMDTHTVIAHSPQRNWLDSIGADCKEMGVTIYDASQLVTNMTRWKNTVKMPRGLPARTDNVIVIMAISK